MVYTKTSPKLLTVGPGTLVRDVNEPTLYDGTAITSATTTNGTWTNVKFPFACSVFLETGTMAGTSSTCDVEIQEADDSSGTNAVTVGHFSQLTEADDNVTKRLNARVHKPYMRAVIVTAGTVTSHTPTVTVRERDDRRQDDSDA